MGLGSETGIRKKPIPDPNSRVQKGTESATLVGWRHRVGRVLSVYPVVGIGTPPPLLPQASVPPHPLVRGGGHTRLRLKGWGSPNSNEGTYTVVLNIYKYFVVGDHMLQDFYAL